MPAEKSTGRIWGLSPRPTAEDLPEWAKDFHGPGWAATPNPEAAASKQQLKARLLLGSILAALPVSLLSCIIATRSSSAPAQPETTRSAEWSLARSEADLEAQRWLSAGGIKSSALTWRESRESLLPCTEGAMCEEHIFTALLDEGTRVLLVVTVDPVEGAIAGVHMLEEPQISESTPEELSEQQRDTQKPNKRPVWSDSRSKAVNEPVTMENLQQRIHTWASAWAKRDLRTLAELAGVTTGVGQNPNDTELGAPPSAAGALESPRPRFDAFVLGNKWWRVPLESVEVLSLVEGPSPSMQLATAAFSLRRECTDGPVENDGGPRAPMCSECSTRSSAGQRLCDGSLDMAADLWIEASRTPVQVRGSAHVGGLDPRIGPSVATAVPRTDAVGG